MAFEYERGLRVVLMLDFEYASRPLTDRDLEEWGISSDEGLACASNNLAVKTGPLWEDASDNARRTGLFKFRTLDGYDASRILLPDLPERAARALHCEKVAVAIPVQHALLAISADDDKDVSELRKNSMLIYQKGRYPLTPETFLMQSGD